MKKRRSYKQHTNVTHKEWRTLNVYQTSMTPAEFQTMRRALAKQANQRLVRLERATSKVTGESYTFGAYDAAEEYLRSTGRAKEGGKIRFSESLKYMEDLSDLRREISALQNFLASESSTVAGMRKIEEKRMEAFEEKGLRFADTKEFYDFLNSKEFTELSNSMASDQLVEIYDEAREKSSHEEIMEAMQAAIESYQSRTSSASIKDLKQRMKKIGGS